jgi:hypothetical protein
MGIKVINFPIPNPFPVPSMTAAEIAAYPTPIAGMIVYDSTNNKLVVRAAAAWETITSV